jgi:hypothetical protein
MPRKGLVVLAVLAMAACSTTTKTGTSASSVEAPIG